MKINKWFTLLLILFPILHLYNAGISTLTVGDILLFIVLIFLTVDIIKNKKKLKINKTLLIISFLILIQLLIYSLLNKYQDKNVMSTMRILLYYVVCSLFVCTYFDIKFGLKCYKIVALVSAIFWLFQYIMLYKFNIFIQGTIPGLKTEIDSFNKIMSAHAWTSIAYTRPRSFFAEPSHFAIYESLILLLSFFDNENRKLIPILIIMIAMFLSGSSMAIALTVITIILFTIEQSKKITRKKIFLLIAVVVILIILCPIYIKSNSFKIFYNRTFIQKDATNGRFGNFITTFKENKNFANFMFGEGIYKISDIVGQNYITSVPRIYEYFGICGMLGFILISTRCFCKLRNNNLLSWILFFVISFVSEIIFSDLILLYLPFIITEEMKNNEQN